MFQLPGGIAPPLSQALDPERSEGSPTNRGILRLRSGLVIEWEITAVVKPVEQEDVPAQLERAHLRFPLRS